MYGDEAELDQPASQDTLSKQTKSMPTNKIHAIKANPRQRRPHADDQNSREKQNLCQRTKSMLANKPHANDQNPCQQKSSHTRKRNHEGDISQHREKLEYH